MTERYTFTRREIIRLGFDTKNKFRHWANEKCSDDDCDSLDKSESEERSVDEEPSPVDDHDFIVHDEDASHNKHKRKIQLAITDESDESNDDKTDESSLSEGEKNDDMLLNNSNESYDSDEDSDDLPDEPTSHGVKRIQTESDNIKRPTKIRCIDLSDD